AFNQEAFNVPSSFLGGGGGPFEIATSTGGNVPIHAIAFEDPGSCRNMKRMAELTGGDYRFVSAGESSEEIVAAAESLLAAQDALERPNELRHALTGLAPILSSAEELQKYADMVHELYRTNLSTAHSSRERLVILNDEMVTLGNLDPGWVALDELRQEIRKELSREIKASFEGEATSLDSIIELITELAKTEIDTVVSDEIMKAAFGGGADVDDIAEAIREVASLSDAEQAAGSGIVKQSLIRCYHQAFETRLDEYRDQGKHAEAIELMLVLSKDSDQRTLRPVMEKALRHHTFEMLDGIRVAARNRQRAEAKQLKAQLDLGFATDPTRLSALRRDFATQERTAESLLTKIKRLPDGPRRTTGLQHLIDNYPHSKSAVKAKQLLQENADNAAQPMGGFGRWQNSARPGIFDRTCSMVIGFC
ncbi:MAG: hypothetical protein AAGJ83_05310, partial [Planctomycetota bacterium]